MLGTPFPSGRKQYSHVTDQQNFFLVCYINGYGVVSGFWVVNQRQITTTGRITGFLLSQCDIYVIRLPSRGSLSYQTKLLSTCRISDLIKILQDLYHLLSYIHVYNATSYLITFRLLTKIFRIVFPPDGSPNIPLSPASGGDS
jgi:hypothetical protein